MKLKIMLTSLLTVATLMLAIPTSAQAQELSVRGEAGLAIPLTEKQSNRFDPGVNLAIRPEITLFHYFGFGPELTYTALPSKVNGVDAGTALALGGFARVKRPHDEENTGTGWSAAAPWAGFNVDYVRTDGLDRFAGGVSAGVQVPTSDSRKLWVGPFVSYQIINDPDYNKVNINTNSAKLLIVGLGLEFGGGVKPAKKNKEEEPKPVETKVEEKPATKETPKETPKPRVVQIKQRIQFAWDSAVLRPTENEHLKEVLKAMTENHDVNVKVEGHASSEGQIEHNNKLSQQRADAVANWLVANGVDRKRVTSSGFGSRVPVATNKTESGRQANRRVEFDVIFTLESK